MPPTVIAETAPLIVNVRALKPLFEDAHTYQPGEEFPTSADRAQQLAALGLVTIIDPTAPRDTRTKLQAAREALHTAEAEAATRGRERAVIQEEVQQAEVKVAALEAAAGTAEGLEAVRLAQDALAEAQRDLASKRAFLANVSRRAQQAAAQAQDARRIVDSLAQRAAQLKAEIIPNQVEHLADCQRVHRQKVQDAENFATQRVHPAEEQLQALQTELASLEG